MKLYHLQYFLFYTMRLMIIEGGQQWPGMEEVSITIDSGAVATLGPKSVAQAFEVKEAEARLRNIVA